jgi:uncharacterized protein (DUF1810 family)
VADFHLERFVDAQAETYGSALSEIGQGAKRGHWMWFMFPQIAGLGSSAMARHYAIGSLNEARAYLAHPVLGARLRECVAALHRLGDTTAERVFGGIDAVKLRSSLTLFAVAGGGADFDHVLGQWFAGQTDEATLRLLEER